MDKNLYVKKCVYCYINYEFDYLIVPSVGGTEEGEPKAGIPEENGPEPRGRGHKRRSTWTN